MGMFRPGSQEDPDPEELTDDLFRAQREVAELKRKLESSDKGIQAVIEAARGVLSPCDDSEKERGFCVGHGTINRLPCPFADLREALDTYQKLKNDPGLPNTAQA